VACDLGSARVPEGSGGLVVVPVAVLGWKRWRAARVGPVATAAASTVTAWMNSGAWGCLITAEQPAVDADEKPPYRSDLEDAGRHCYPGDDGTRGNEQQNGQRQSGAEGEKEQGTDVRNVALPEVGAQVQVDSGGGGQKACGGQAEHEDDSRSWRSPYP
jgi:hypothetical protein